MKLKKCKICSNSFQTKPRKKFCLRRCYDIDYRGVPFICKQCGKDFTFDKNKKRSYCSNECVSIAKKVQKQSKNGSRIKICKLCDTEFTDKFKWNQRFYCSEECNSKVNRFSYYNMDNKELLKLYKVNKCEICGTQFDNSTHRKCIDHCHTTEKVRGIICQACNTALGNVKDSVQTLKNAVKYLERK